MFRARGELGECGSLDPGDVASKETSGVSPQPAATSKAAIPGATPTTPSLRPCPLPARLGTARLFPGWCSAVPLHPATCHGHLPACSGLTVVWIPVASPIKSSGCPGPQPPSFTGSQMHFTVLWSICPHGGQAIATVTQSWSGRTSAAPRPGPLSDDPDDRTAWISGSLLSIWLSQQSSPLLVHGSWGELPPERPGSLGVVEEVMDAPTLCLANSPSVHLTLNHPEAPPPSGAMWP